MTGGNYSVTVPHIFVREKERCGRRASRRTLHPEMQVRVLPPQPAWKEALLPHENAMTPEEQIERLNRQIQDTNEKFAKRRARINNELRRVRARIAACKRKLDTRRKILIGSAVIAAAEDRPPVQQVAQGRFPSPSDERPRPRSVRPVRFRRDRQARPRPAPPLG